MAKPFHLPGTWSVTAASSLGHPHPIFVFTADRSMVERVDVTPETALGVWRWMPTGKGRFQFMWIRPVAVPPPFAPVGTAALRMRSMNHFTGPDSFSGTACLDALDSDGNVIEPPGIEKTTHDAVRMRLVPWHEDCHAP